ncbi:MAG TPA: 6-phospho-3-hexuloisomerase [Candidatus Thermoplasmatota archaeon]|nr:6-phospho-3-hexuloisomerase [Candidatus Thermoplasmatota archaeon]
MARAKASKPTPTSEARRPSGDDRPSHREAAHYILNQIRATVDNVDDAEVIRLIDLMRAAKSVIVFGRGRSGFVGRGFVVRLTHLGIPAYFVGETVSPPVHGDDLVVLLSGSGETFSVVVTGQTAKKLGSRIVSITGNPDSTLGKMGDLTILLRTPTGDRQRALAPLGTLFEAASEVFLDGVVAELMRRVGATEETMRARHATLE